MGFDTEPYDSALIGGLQKNFGSLAGRLEKLERFLTAQANERLAQEIDGSFAALGESYSSLFGSKPIAELQPDSQEYKLRLFLWEQVKDQPGPVRQKLAAAAEKFFGRLAGAPAPAAEPAPKPQPLPQRGPDGRFLGGVLPQRREDWQHAGLARPTQRAGAAEPPGERKALQTAARVMRERGLGDEESADGFLD